MQIFTYEENGQKKELPLREYIDPEKINAEIDGILKRNIIKLKRLKGDIYQHYNFECKLIWDSMKHSLTSDEWKYCRKLYNDAHKELVYNIKKTNRYMYGNLISLAQMNEYGLTYAADVINILSKQFYDDYDRICDEIEESEPEAIALLENMCQLNALYSVTSSVLQCARVCQILNKNYLKVKDVPYVNVEQVCLNGVMTLSVPAGEKYGINAYKDSKPTVALKHEFLR